MIKVKGDTIKIRFTVNTDITDWKIRCSIYDSCSHSIKLASANSGGSTSEISIENASAGIFLVVVAKDLTNCYDEKSFIEVELENTDGEVFTVYQSNLTLKEQHLTWTTPND